MSEPDPPIRCAVCGSTVWVACRPATLEAWCVEHWPAERQRRSGNAEGNIEQQREPPRDRHERGAKFARRAEGRAATAKG
jgi:hypothetical protein